jgi:hypothetical protein
MTTVIRRCSGRPSSTLNDPAAQYTYDEPGGTTTVPQDTRATDLLLRRSHRSLQRADAREGQHHIVSISPFAIGPSDVLGRCVGPGRVRFEWNAEILSINKTVARSSTPTTSVGTTSTRAAWSIFGSDPSGNEVGTNELENTTMETLTQGGTF